MPNDAFRVTEVNCHDGPFRVYLGNSGQPMQLNTEASNILERLARETKRTFLLQWEGGKIPNGAHVNGYMISTVYDTRVIAGGEVVAVAAHFKVNGGASGREQAMLLFFV